jgi:hypothetical protein
MSRFAAMVNVALLLAMTVIALGAYTRLTDEGLGQGVMASSPLRNIVIISLRRN